MTRTVLPLAAAAAAVRNLRVHLADQIFLLLERPGFLVTLNAGETVATVLLCAAGLAWAGFPARASAALSRRR